MRIKLGWLLLAIGVIAVLGYTFIGFYQDVEKYGFLKVVFDPRFSLDKVPHPISSVVWTTVIWLKFAFIIINIIRIYFAGVNLRNRHRGG